MPSILLGSISTVADASELRQARAETRAPAGVLETISTAKSQRLKVALVTTTAEQNIASLIQALSPAIERAHVETIGTSASVERPKPDQATCFSPPSAGFGQTAPAQAVDRTVPVVS